MRKCNKEIYWIQAKRSRAWVEKSQDMDEAVETFGGVRYQLLSYGAFYEADVHWKAQVNKKRAPVL